MAQVITEACSDVKDGQPGLENMSGSISNSSGLP